MMAADVVTFDEVSKATVSASVATTPYRSTAAHVPDPWPAYPTYPEELAFWSQAFCAYTAGRIQGWSSEHDAANYADRALYLYRIRAGRVPVK